MPQYAEAIIYRPVRGENIWADLPKRGRLMCAITRKRSRNFAVSLVGGAWYEYEVGPNNIKVWRDGEPAILAQPEDFNDTYIADVFLYPIARFRVPIQPIEGPDDVKALRRGDALVALARTLDDPEYKDANIPFAHAGQLCFVKQRFGLSGGDINISLVGLPNRKEPLDFGETFEWGSTQEARARGGTALDPADAFPLGKFFAKIVWPDLDALAPDGSNANLGDLLIAGDNGYDPLHLESGEPAAVVKKAKNRLDVHAAGIRAEMVAADFTKASLRLLPITTLRERLTPERLKTLPLGTIIWTAPQPTPRIPKTPFGIAQGAPVVVKKHHANGQGVDLAAAYAPDADVPFEYADAPLFEADPDDGSTTAQAAAPPAAGSPPRRVPLTLDRARRLKKDDPMWVSANATTLLPGLAGTMVTFEGINEKRNRISWKNAQGRSAGDKLSVAINDAWFEVEDDGRSTQAQLPQGEDAHAPLTRAAFEALQAGSILLGAVTDPQEGVTEGNEYPVKAVTTGKNRTVTVTLDTGADKTFAWMDAARLFDVRAKDAPALDADDADPEDTAPAAGDPAAGSVTLPVDPKEAQEEQEYQRELVRDRPLRGPSFRHRARVLATVRRLLGEPAPGGVYTPGLYALAEYGPIYDLLGAGWLVRDGSTMLMGIAGTGKTTFIRAGTRLFCGAPPRLIPADDYDAAVQTSDPRAKRAALQRLRVGTLRVHGRIQPATDAAFDALVAEQAEVRKKAWMVPVNADTALRIERQRRLGWQPHPDEDATLYMRGTSESIILAWSIHDAANAPLMLGPDATVKQRQQAEENAAQVTEAQAAFYREVFGSFFDYFHSTFVGLAKSDPEKQPDEVLYKSRVLNVKYPDVAEIAKAIPDTFGTPKGEATETTIFPEPHPVVIAPVKFLNEANRMSRPLGDAFLGLLSEKEVEYRGATFRSPDYVVWLDMNPHLGWGPLDWAFLDRIDVSCVLPALGFAMKTALEDTRLGRRRAQQAAYVTDAPEFSLDELLEIWRDVEAVDVGDYWPDDLMADIATIGLPLPTPSMKEAGHPTVTYDPIYALRFAGAALEYFIATPEGFDWSRFVPHPNKSPDPNDPRSGGGEHWDHLYHGMLEKNKLAGDNLPPTAIFAKLQRPFGFRAQASLRKFSKAFAWLRGSRKVEVEDILAVLPFVLAHRLMVNYEESRMGEYFSTYDWLTRKNGEGQADGSTQGQIEHVKDRLTAWTPALARLYKLQLVHFLMVSPDGAHAIQPGDYEKAIDLAKRWLGPNDDEMDDKSISALRAEQPHDGVLRQVEKEAKSLLAQIEQEKDNAVVRALPERIANRKFNRKDVEEWESRLPIFLAHAGNRKVGRALRNAIDEAKAFLDLRIPFVGDGAAGYNGPNELSLDDEAQYNAIVGALIAQTRDADDRSQALASWRAAEKTFKDEQAKGANPTTLAPFETKLPGVGRLTIAFEAQQPLTKTVRLAFDTASAAKKARTMLKRDFQYDAG